MATDQELGFPSWTAPFTVFHHEQENWSIRDAHGYVIVCDHDTRETVDLIAKALNQQAPPPAVREAAVRLQQFPGHAKKADVLTVCRWVMGK